MLKNQKKQKGFSLVELMIVMAILGIMMTFFVNYMSQQNLIREAKDLGNRLAQYVGATEQRIVTDTNLSIGTYQGVNWLKDDKCDGGESPKPYLPCSFRIYSPLLEESASDAGDKDLISVDVQQAEKDKIKAIITIGPVQNHTGSEREDSGYLASVVMNTALAYMGTTDAGSTNAITSYTFDKLTGVITIEIVSQQTGDIWLRVDGGNSMRNNIYFDMDSENRGIVDVDSIAFHNEDVANITNEFGELSMVAEALHFNDQADSAGKYGDIFLGNQTGDERNSNVIVNDLTIASKNNLKLSNFIDGVGIKRTQFFSGNSRVPLKPDNPDGYKGPLDEDNPYIDYAPECAEEGLENKIYLSITSEVLEFNRVKFDVTTLGAGLTTITEYIPSFRHGVWAVNTGHGWELHSTGYFKYHGIAFVGCDYKNK